MATLRLPTFRENLDHKYNLILDAETFTIEYHYNARADRWIVHVFDVEDVAVRHGVRLVVGGIDLLRRVALATKPQGEITIVDTTGNDTEPDLTTLGEEPQVRYTEAADL